MALALRYLAHSEIGLVRKNNQDSAYVSPTMLMVADGMGGAAAGDLASAIAVRQLAAADAEAGQASGEAMLTVVNDAIRKASDLISDLIEEDPELDGMGSTVCGVMFDGEKLGLANIGDSRAYRYRDGRLTRLSRDHSWVQTLVDEGRITEAEALEHPHRSLILKVVNGQPQHQPDLELVDVAAGDRLLICSDGLCGMVTDEVIATRMSGDLDEVMASLVRVAHLEGAQDNITIVLADVVEGEPEGEPQILGAAAVIDLDGTNEHTLVQRLTDDPSLRPDPAASEIARYAPTTRHRARTWVKVTLGVLLPLLAVSIGAALWYSYTQTQYYVGAESAKLAIFQGIPEPVFRLPLSHVVQTDDTSITDLPPYYQQQVMQTMPADSLDDARQTVVMLRAKAAECVRQRQQTHAPSTTPTRGLPDGTASASAPPSASLPPLLATPSPTATSSTTTPTDC